MKKGIILFLLFTILINAIELDNIFTDSSINYNDDCNEVQSISGHLGGVSSLVYSPNGKYLASGSYDKTIKIWGSITGKEILELSGSNR